MTQQMRVGIAIALLASTVGCGSGRPDRLEVSGRIVLDGQPLTMPEGATGFVQFVPSGARAAAGEIDSQGRFELTTFGDEGGGDGCVPGTHVVAVTVYQQLSPTARRWLAPKEYSNRKTSGLTVAIDQPTDTLELNLTWGGKKPFVERLAGGKEVDAALME
ncbi:MAG: hypothetical protein AAGJ46_02320 [Planctomycetota bacterium]